MYLYYKYYESAVCVFIYFKNAKATKRINWDKMLYVWVLYLVSAWVQYRFNTLYSFKIAAVRNDTITRVICPSLQCINGVLLA